MTLTSLLPKELHTMASPWSSTTWSVDVLGPFPLSKG